jgi:septal ring factor EnvC (AmiA/AmiB activator)
MLLKNGAPGKSSFGNLTVSKKCMRIIPFESRVTGAPRRSMLLIQTEILASLQSIDQKIEQQQERKQRLLGELEAQEEEIRAKKQEIDALVAGFAEKNNCAWKKIAFFRMKARR